MKAQRRSNYATHTRRATWRPACNSRIPTDVPAASRPGYADVDIRHAEEARQLLKMYLRTEQDSLDAFNGSVEIADALWDLLMEIGFRHNIAPLGGQEWS